ncbi:hypothetical protein AgCh_011750 [Apium graveolens]
MQVKAQLVEVLRKAEDKLMYMLCSIIHDAGRAQLNGKISGYYYLGSSICTTLVEVVNYQLDKLKELHLLRPWLMNRRYVEQLVASAEAAVEKVIRRGVAHQNKISVGGHSYGAFMTANLLAHAPHLFCCGIARSGAYNRTLTPFEF